MRDEVPEVLQEIVLDRGDADQPPGLGEDPLGDGAALLAVAAEEVRAGVTPLDQRQLPGQVECVLHARVHALAAGGAVDVRGVAGKEYPARAVVLDLALVHPEAREPDRIGERDAGRAPGDDGLDLLEGGLVQRARTDVGDDAVASGRDRKKHDGAVAMPEDRELRLRQIEAGDVDVGEQEGRWQRVAAERHPERLPHQGVCAIAADEPACLESLAAPVRVAKPARHAVFGLGEARQRDAALDLAAER